MHKQENAEQNVAAISADQVPLWKCDERRVRRERPL